MDGISNMDLQTMEAFSTLSYVSIEFTDPEDKINLLGEGNVLEGWNYAGIYFHICTTLRHRSMYSFAVPCPFA